MQRFREGNKFEEIAAYSRAVKVSGVVAVSGTAALGPDGKALYPGDIYAQSKHALQAALHAAMSLGASREDVIRTRMLLVTGSDWQAAVRAHGEFLPDVNPANTTWFVGGLIPDGALVEVELDAVIPSELAGTESTGA
jgi:enamine deaminase RidA (YjgF/YER057c/UK114 family)